MERIVNIVKRMNSKNISNDSEITSKRCREEWERFTNEEKHRVAYLAGFEYFYAIYKTFREGRISVKVAMAFAIVSKITPFYFIEAGHTQKALEREEVDNFLKKNWSNYSLFKNEVSQMLEVIFDSENFIEKEDNQLETRAFPIITEDVMNKIRLLTDEDYIALLKAAMLKEKINKKNNEKVLIIKALLLSEE